MEQTQFPIYLLLLILFFITIKLLLRSKKSYKNLPPSPPYYLPILGHLHLLKHPLHRTLNRISQNHGPIFSLWFGSRRVIVVSSASIAEECFTKNDIVLANRPRLLFSKHLGYNYTTMMSSPYGNHWRNLRRIGALQIFATNRINLFSNIRRDEIKRLLHKLSQNSIRDFAKVDLKSMFVELTFNIMMRMIAGKRYYGNEVNNKEEALKFREIMREVFKLIGAANPGDFIPMLNWISSESLEKRLIKIGKRTDAFLQDLVDEARTNMGIKENTMIDHLLSLQQSQPDYYTDKTIKGFILVILLAGTETSALTMEWVMANLLNHPKVLSKATIELNNQIGNQHLLEESDLSKLSYLHCIIAESLRLFPTGPLIPHYSSDNCVIGGYDFPRDTILLVNVWAIHRDPKSWDDSEYFKPERFENIDDKKNVEYKFMPFGMGRRACPGATLSQRVMSLTLGSLIQCFEWKRVNDKEIDMKEGKGITMPKDVPLEAMCKALPIIKNILLTDQVMDDV